MGSKQALVFLHKFELLG